MWRRGSGIREFIACRRIEQTIYRHWTTYFFLVAQISCRDLLLNCVLPESIPPAKPPEFAPQGYIYFHCSLSLHPLQFRSHWKSTSFFKSREFHKLKPTVHFGPSIKGSGPSYMMSTSVPPTFYFIHGA